MRLREIRKERGLTQAELAVSAGVALITVRNLEQGRYRTAPQYGTVAKISVALGVDAAEVEEFAPALAEFEAQTRPRTRPDEAFRAAIAETVRAEVERQLAELGIGAAAQREARVDG